MIRRPPRSTRSEFYSPTIKNMLYLGQISIWEEVVQPIGKLCCTIGNSGDLEAETVGLLLEAGIDYSDHPPAVEKELPKLPWTIPQSELTKRRDYTDQCIFTIDPADARDLDDAVAGEFIGTAEDGVTKLYKVSVHIADVSYFVRENSVLDGIASERATSTYLVDRVIPMLPGVLCETVCSLNPGEKRLAFSIEWILDENGNIIDEWIGRSIIQSCTKLSYDHAQALIDETTAVFPMIVSPFQLNDIRQSVKILHQLAVKLREKRYHNGALKIDLPRLSFSMDWQTRTPIGFHIYKMRESNQLIEEFMLLANTRVAEKIFSTFPEIAVLRCHPPPQPRLLKGVADTLEKLGIHIDISDSGSIQKSLWQYILQDGDFHSVGRNLVLCNLIAKPMKCAMYICSGFEQSRDAFRHYALSVPLYTHFTSPIRRYPDILVHRLLSAALEKKDMKHWEPVVLKKLLGNCNDKKLAAKSVGELHSELHLSALLKRSGPLEVKSVVVGVLDHAVDVILLHIGITRRVYLDRLPLRELNHEILGGVGTLVLEWDLKDPVNPPIRQLITLFTVLDVILVPDENELRFDVVLQSPLLSR
nr:EOG090X047D [Cyclestheria hislopi]